MDYSKLEATVASVLATPYEDERVHELAQVLAEVLAASTLQPCHLLTSAHGEEHHTRGGVCEHMLGATARRVAAALGTTPKGLPHELHLEEECETCYAIPAKQEGRDKLIANWEWAGLKPTAPMRELASDAIHPGDDRLFRAVLTPRFQELDELVSALSQHLPTVKPAALRSRFSKVAQGLAKAGKLEQYSSFFRLPSPDRPLPAQAPYPRQIWRHATTGEQYVVSGLHGPSRISVRQGRGELESISRADFYQDFIFVGHR